MIKRTKFNDKKVFKEIEGNSTDISSLEAANVNNIVYLLNNSNLISDPTMLEDNIWKGGTLVDVNGSLSKGRSVTAVGATVPLTYIIPIDDIENGSYYTSIKRKLVSGTVTNGKIQMLAGIIDSAGNFGGYGSVAATASASSDELQELTFTLNKATVLTSYPLTTHLALQFTTSQGRTQIMYEPILCLSTQENKTFYAKKYLDDINSKNPLYAKKFVVNGDSIMYGLGSAGGFSKQIADNNRMTFVNKAVAGGTATYGTLGSDGTTPRHWVCDTVDDMDEDADYILFLVGYNDFGITATLGTITADFATALDNATFCGGMESICKQAKEKWPTKKIGVVIPHKINNTFYPYGRATDTGYAGVARYRELTIDICKKWGIPVCDLFTLSPLNTALEAMKTAYTKDGDGIHPNELGYRLFYTPIVEAWMKTL